MPDERLRELINHDLDGETTRQERAELERMIQGDPDACRIHDEMKAVNELLDDCEGFEPPAALRQEIAEEVRRVSGKHTRGRFASKKKDRLALVSAGFAAAAVLAVGFLLSPAIVKSVDPAKAGGTMGPTIDETSEAPSSDETSVLPIDGNGVQGSILTSTAGRELIIRLDVEPEGQGHLEVEFDPIDAVFVSARGGTSQFVLQAGRVTVEFDREMPELRFERLHEGKVSVSLKIISGESMPSYTEVSFPATNFLEGNR